MAPRDRKPDVRSADERTQLESFLAEYRSRLPATLDGLDEEQARRRLVPSRTTLLGLVKHITFVENVWFDEAITGTPRKDLGPATTDGSFRLTKRDTIAGVRERHAQVAEAARQRLAELTLDHEPAASGGTLSVRFLYLQCIREYAHHTGHADILREQILAP